MWERSDSELLFSAAALIQHVDNLAETSLFVCSVIYVAAPLLLEQTTGNFGCHNQSINKLLLDYTLWSFPKKKKTHDTVSRDNLQTLSEGKQSYCFYFRAKQNWYD